MRAQRNILYIRLINNEPKNLKIMKTLKKLVLFGLILSVGFFTACEDDKDEELSYEESKETLQEMDSQMVADFEEMSQSDGMTAFATLQHMDDPFAEQKSTKESHVIANIKEYALPIGKKIKSTKAESSFDFDNNVGTYTWNNTEGYWAVTPDDPSDKIVVNFPADSTNMDDNNATLTIYNYEEQESDGDNVYYQPTAIEADLVIDGTEYVNLSLTAEWDDNGEPEILNVSVFLNPFTYTGEIETTSTSGSIDFAINYDDNQIFSTGIDIDFKDDTKEEPKLIDGFFQYRKAKIEAKINVENIEQIIEDLESGDSDYETMEGAIDAVNDEIDAKIFHDGKKVADIEIGEIDDETGEPIIILVFNDGTEENAEQYFDNFATNIEEFLNNMEFQF